MKSSTIANLIRKGGVLSGVEGSTPEEVYKAVCNAVPLPEGINRDALCSALVEREKVLSTAVGSGIALPHTRVPLLKSVDDQEICVIYLKEPISMGSPDARNVFVMFLLLTANPQVHLEVLSTLVKLFRKPSFYSLLEKQAGADELIEAIENSDK